MSNSKNKEATVLEYLRSFVNENGYPPTVRELCEAMGFASSATGQYYLKKLKESGAITTRGDGRNRTISLSNQGGVTMVPVIGEVTAGSPIFAVENFDGYYPLPEEFHADEDTFILTVRGTSMINAGILNGDKIIVKKTSVCKDGDIVVALWEDGATCKRFFRQNGRFILHPENDALCDIVLDEVSIIGVVRGLIRKF